MLHAAVLGALLARVGKPPAEPPAEAARIEMVFQPPAAQAEAAEAEEHPAPVAEPPAERPAETRPDASAVDPPTAATPPAETAPAPPPAATSPPDVAPRPTAPLVPPEPVKLAAAPPPPRTKLERVRPQDAAKPVVQPARETAPARPTPVPPVRAMASLPEKAVAPRPAPASPPVVPPVTSGPVIDPGWQRAVSAWLAAARAYPEEARRRGEEGRVSVRFTVDRSGHVTEAMVVGPSGSALLDGAVLTLLRQGVLPAFPGSMPQPRVTVTAPVRYTLR